MDIQDKVNMLLYKTQNNQDKVNLLLSKTQELTELVKSMDKRLKSVEAKTSKQSESDPISWQLPM